MELLLGKGVQVQSGALEELAMMDCELLPLTLEALQGMCKGGQMENVQKQGRKEKQSIEEKQRSQDEDMKQRLDELVGIAKKILCVCVMILFVCMYDAVN